MGAAARDDEIDDLLRSRPPIDVIAEKNLKHPRPRIVGKVGVDRGEQFRQQIGTPMHIPDGVDAQPVRQPPDRAPGAGFQEFPHARALRSRTKIEVEPRQSRAELMNGIVLLKTYWR